MITIYTIDEINNFIQPGKTFKEYKILYNNLIKKCRKRGLDKGQFPGIYLETHHILPKSQKGTDDSNNLVLLTAAEHILAHVLLWYIHPDHVGLTIAAAMMVSLDRRNGHISDFVSMNLKDIISKLDIEVVATIRAKRAEDAKKRVICWDKDILGNIIILKIYDYLNEVPLLENREGKKGWRIIGNFLDDFKYHSGYYWGSIGFFEENYPEILEKYLKNPTPKEKQIPVKANHNIYSLPAIVCHDKDFNIKRIFHRYKDLLDIGLTITNTKNAAKKNGGLSMGYFWSYLEWFRENHRNKLEEYVLKGCPELEIIPKDGKTSPKAVLIYDPKTFQVLRVYDTSYSSKKDGFDGFRLAKKAEERDKGGDNNYNGHYVSYVKSWEYPEKLKEYYNNPPKIEIWNDMANSITILKCDFNKDIIATFENRIALDVGGIWDNTLSEKIDRELLHRGFYYYHPAYYKEHYPEKWKIYQEKGCTGLEEFNAKNVVVVDSKFNITDLMFDEYGDRRKLDLTQDTYILRNKRLSKKDVLVWRLDKFVSKYPDKWLDYLRNKHNNLTKLDDETV